MTTKYNIGDKVWFMYMNRPTEGIIQEININENQEVIYSIRDFKYAQISNHLGYTKRELLNSFLTEEDKL